MIDASTSVTHSVSGQHSYTSWGGVNVSAIA